MQRNLIIPIFLAIIAVSGLAYLVQGQSLEGVEVWQTGVGDQIVAVALSPDGLYGAVTTEEKVYLYDRNGAILWSYPVSHCRSVAVSSDGERIVAGGDHLLLFDRKGNVIWRVKPGSRIQSVAVAADGSTVCAGAGTSLRVFSLDDGQAAANLSWSFDTGDSIESISIDGEGSRIVAGGNSGNIYFFNRDGRLLWNYRTISDSVRVAVSYDGSTVAATSLQRVVFLFNQNGRLLWKSPMPERGTDMSISGDGSILVLASGDITVFNRSGEVVWTYATEKEIRCASISSDATHLLAGALDGTVWAFRVRSETLPADTPEVPRPDAAFTAEPSQTSVAPAPGQTLPQQGTTLSPATPGAVGACLVALVWWGWKRRRA